jgi:chromosome segregation ATPase
MEWFRSEMEALRNRVAAIEEANNTAWRSRTDFEGRVNAIEQGHTFAVQQTVRGVQDVTAQLTELGNSIREFPSATNLHRIMRQLKWLDTSAGLELESVMKRVDGRLVALEDALKPNTSLEVRVATLEQHQSAAVRQSSRAIEDVTARVAELGASIQGLPSAPQMRLALGQAAKIDDAVARINELGVSFQVFPSAAEMRLVYKQLQWVSGPDGLESALGKMDGRLLMVEDHVQSFRQTTKACLDEHNKLKLALTAKLEALSSSLNDKFAQKVERSEQASLREAFDSLDAEHKKHLQAFAISLGQVSKELHIPIDACNQHVTLLQESKRVIEQSVEACRHEMARLSNMCDWLKDAENNLSERIITLEHRWLRATPRRTNARAASTERTPWTNENRPTSARYAAGIDGRWPNCNLPGLPAFAGPANWIP